MVDVGYVGNFDRHARYAPFRARIPTLHVQLNPVPYQAYANPANLFNNTEINANLVRTAYPGMGAISYTSFGLSAVNYHGLQMAAQHR